MPGLLFQLVVVMIAMVLLLNNDHFVIVVMIAPQPAMISVAITIPVSVLDFHTNSYFFGVSQAFFAYKRRADERRTYEKAQGKK
jgi:hypothetical protein